MASTVAAGFRSLVATTPLLQLPQRDAEADAVAAADIAVDDDGGERGFVEAGFMVQFGATFLMYFDVWRTQLVQRIDQAGFRVLAYLGCEVARIEQYELRAVGTGRAHLADKVAQVAASAQLQRASRRAGLLLKLLLQFLGKRVAGRVRPMDDHNAHSMVLFGAPGSG
ncbi:hypothetical protein Y882_05965 [Dyella japonica DSM 16301]|uniref:Uncharacterized protein n=1 Tax=Dyella japonica DSM 16301 TaxID=1440762 RepID=A0A0G9H5U5_9GAMM|nr:hypothetical protein Y882_05965 [Dyella japonica DSM 16301]